MSFSVFSSKEGEYQFPEFLIGHHEICGSGQNVKCLQLDFYKKMAVPAHDNLHITQSFVPIHPATRRMNTLGDTGHTAATRQKIK